MIQKFFDSSRPNILQSSPICTHSCEKEEQCTWDVLTALLSDAMGQLGGDNQHNSCLNNRSYHVTACLHQMCTHQWLLLLPTSRSYCEVLFGTPVYRTETCGHALMKKTDGRLLSTHLTIPKTMSKLEVSKKQV